MTLEAAMEGCRRSAEHLLSTVRDFRSDIAQGAPNPTALPREELLRRLDRIEKMAAELEEGSHL
jgi:hypothetical protein